MLFYLRNFFGASVVLIIIAIFVVAYSFNLAANNVILQQAERGNTTLTKGFYNNVWKKNPEIKTIFYRVAPKEQLKYKEFLDFIKNTLFHLQDIPIVKFNIYSPDGRILFSTDQRKIYLADSAFSNSQIKGDINKKLSAANATGNPISEIVEHAQFQTPSGRFKKGTLVRTLVPLYPDDFVEILDIRANKIEAVVEVFVDVTEYSEDLRFYQTIGTGFAIISFLGMYAGFFISSRRAEKIIERQHETYVELETAKARAETENSQKSQFLANISHELRTPLNAIIGFSEIIKDEVMGELGNDQYKTYVRDIHSSGVHLLSLINDILDYSKAEAGKLDIEIEEVDVSKIILSCLRLQEPRAKNAEVNLAKELPSERIIIHTDAKRLKQILLNLLSNAVKFTPNGGTVKISGWQNVKDDTISIEVKDTGIGIAPKDLARALSPFGQVDSELARRYEGTGLGLPLTKKFVELLGGKLHLESEVGKGTTVTVTLPAEPVAADGQALIKSKASNIGASF
jgi:two-component system cell cycle sensor histidine kinase PleC